VQQSNSSCKNANASTTRILGCRDARAWPITIMMGALHRRAAPTTHTTAAGSSRPIRLFASASLCSQLALFTRHCSLAGNIDQPTQAFSKLAAAGPSISGRPLTRSQVSYHACYASVGNVKALVQKGGLIKPQAFELWRLDLNRTAWT
jgi:hypothetical protein